MLKTINEGKKIENKSFEIIGVLLKKKGIVLSGLKKPVITRAIHTSVDLGCVKDMVFSPDAIARGLKAIRQGNNIVTDSTMVKAGINKSIIAHFKNKIICRMHDKDVARKAGGIKSYPGYCRDAQVSKGS